MEELYQEFKHDPLYEKFALHIEGLVSSGQLQPSDRLPSERELAEGLGVGRLWASCKIPRFPIQVPRWKTA